MFCTTCGAKNSDEAIFCQKCGKKLQPTSQDEQIVSSPQPESNKSAQSQSNSKWLWIMLGIIVLIVGLLGGVYFVSQNNNAVSYNQTSNDTSGNNSTGNSSQNADPSQIQPVLQQFCQDTVSGNYQSAWGLLSKQEQFNVVDGKTLEHSLKVELSGNDISRVNALMNGGTFAITSCAFTGDPLVTQVSGYITARQHVTWNFNLGVPYSGEFGLIVENGSWKINSF